MICNDVCTLANSKNIVALGLFNSCMEQKKQFDLDIFKRVLSLAMPYKGILIFCASLAVILAPVTVIRPYLIKVMVDEYIFKSDIDGMIFMVGIILVVLLFNVLLRYLFIYFSNWLGQSVIRDLRISVFNHITSLKLRYFDQTPIGTSTTRTINDIETINSIFTQGVITIIADLLTLVAVLVIMTVTSWKLTLICLSTAPFLVLASYIFKEKVKASYQIVRTQIQKMNAFLQERITGMKIVQIFNAEKKQMGIFKDINHEYTQANLNSIFYYAVFFPVVEIISAVALGLMVWWGAKGVIAGDVSLGALIAFPLFLSLLFRPIRLLADKVNTLQMGLVAAGRVFNLLDNKDHISDTGTIEVTKLKGDIKFENVHFAYNDKDFVLRDISFTVKEGETLAIVGSTGSGKSTIINILNRFYELNQGAIKIGKVDIKDMTLESLRSRISIVLQDVFLFSGSVLENINLKNPSISRAQVIKASKMIGAHEFIEKLPGGYDYEVMERGATLSMGQRQLISFVRALVFQPDILILDEATSSIDPETEGVIQYAIEKLIDKRTSIIIAHRLSTIKHADKIMVLDKGRIAEFGSHQALIAKEEGHYKSLYEMQFIEVG